MYDFIIVGQGIAGTTICHRLLTAGKKVLVIDPCVENATMVAAGNINPVTGRHYTKSWMMEHLLPEAISLYSELSKLLGIQTFKQNPIYWPLHSVKEENNWLSRMNDDGYDKYLSNLPEFPPLKEKIVEPLSVGRIDGAIQVKTVDLITNYRSYLEDNGLFMQTEFDFDLIKVYEDKIVYDDIEASQIIFPEGHRVVKNPFFTYLPVEPTKGEVLIVELEQKIDCNLREKTFISPLDNGYWVGSGYQWQFENEGPSKEGREILEEKLNLFLKMSYEVLDHKAGIRPCAKDRKPLIGRHEKHVNLIIFNGLGTKGTSLAPYFSKMLSNHLLADEDIMEEVDIRRYSNLQENR